MPAAYRADKPWSSWRYRQARTIVLAASDVCGICGHGGAKSIDHIIPLAQWPKAPDGKLLPGHDAVENLQPAHGTMGAGRVRLHNPCPVCGRLCNQSRGADQVKETPHSRRW